MKIQIKQLVLVFILLVSQIIIFDANAGSNSFQIAPAPVPYPYYESNKVTNRYHASYTEMKGDGLEIVGGGFNFSSRQVLKETKGAIDAGGGLAMLFGEMDFGTAKGDLFVMPWNIAINFERQLIKKKYFSLIGFGGLNFPMFVSSFSLETADMSISSTSYGIMYGIPFGAQGGLHLHKDWTLAPFMMFNWILGGGVTTDTYTTAGGYTTSSSDSDSIDSYLGYSYGMDIFYEPLNIGIGALVQMADGGGDAGAIETRAFTISWKQDL